MSLKLNTPTPIGNYFFKDINFLLKRDDLIHKEFSGNKARKAKYFLDNPPRNINSITSYGSIQSNAMFSLSFLAKELGLKFYYYANHIPSLLKYKPMGNLKLALQNGMILKEGYKDIKIDNSTLFIKEGMAVKEAYYGVKELAIELIEQLDKNQEYQIFLSSGTGATSLFLSKALKEFKADNLTVFTTPCVGKEEYLIKQFLELEPNREFHPKIINTKKHYHFGKLYKEFYQIWLELHKETGVEFELLYDPKGWIAILENKEQFFNLVYIHQGGVIGNESMLERYKRKFGELNENNQYK